MMTQQEIHEAGHWADLWARKVVDQKGDKELYTCASGITPSGTVHIGNFREIISVDLIVRSLRQLGKKVRFIYSWDDYDVFRKVPSNMNNPALLEQYLRKSIDGVPDVTGQYQSYAQANEQYLERLLPLVGITPEYIYQSKRYRSSYYAEGIKRALERTDLIKAELNEFRKDDLSDDWMPVSIFCEACDKDTTHPLSWDGSYGVEYHCDACGHHATLDLRTTGAAKLPWRIDWPMRWAKEGVDFEPAGKDHHSEGGSFSTAKKTVSEIYDATPPVSFQYDFVRIKGGTGKISSSSGEVVDLNDCLQIYQSELVRFLFASTRPNSEFAISFDLDVLKNYEDYDKVERLYYSKPETSDRKNYKKWLISSRIYELSQVATVEAVMPYQIQVRHLCNYLQVNGGDIEATITMLGNVDEHQKERLVRRCHCAWNWITHYAPEEFKFALSNPSHRVDLSEVELLIVREFYRLIPLIDQLTEQDFSSKLYDITTSRALDSSIMFCAIYKVLLGKEKGPRLINFLYTIGSNKIEERVANYL